MLLDRLRHYESLLRENNIEFEPLHKESSTIEKESGSPGDSVGYGSQNDEQPGAVASRDQSSISSPTGKSETAYKAKYALPLQEKYTSG